MPSNKITKSDFKQDYNIVEVFNDKTSIMEKLQTFNSNNQAVAFGVKKTPRDTMPEWFRAWYTDYQKKLDVTLEDIKSEIKGIKTRLDNIVILNNLKE